MENEKKFNLFEFMASISVIMTFVCFGGLIGFFVGSVFDFSLLFPILTGIVVSLVVLNEGTKPNGILIR